MLRTNKGFDKAPLAARQVSLNKEDVTPTAGCRRPGTSMCVCVFPCVCVCGMSADPRDYRAERRDGSVSMKYSLPE